MNLQDLIEKWEKEFDIESRKANDDNLDELEQASAISSSFQIVLFLDDLKKLNK